MDSYTSYSSLLLRKSSLIRVESSFNFFIYAMPNMDVEHNNKKVPHLLLLWYNVNVSQKIV